MPLDELTVPVPPRSPTLPTGRPRPQPARRGPAHARVFPAASAPRPLADLGRGVVAGLRLGRLSRALPARRRRGRVRRGHPDRGRGALARAAAALAGAGRRAVERQVGGVRARARAARRGRARRGERRQCGARGAGRCRARSGRQGAGAAARAACCCGARTWRTGWTSAPPRRAAGLARRLERRPGPDRRLPKACFAVGIAGTLSPVRLSLQGGGAASPTATARSPRASSMSGPSAGLRHRSPIRRRRRGVDGAAAEDRRFRGPSRDALRRAARRRGAPGGWSVDAGGPAARRRARRAGRPNGSPRACRRSCGWRACCR